MNIQKVKEVFNEYVSEFDLSEYRIILKKEHTYRVIEFAKSIAESLHLSQEQIFLAKTIACLHDLGRFEQWTQFKTFADKHSFDHGDFANKLLFEDGYINKFNISKKYHATIYFAVKYHNKYAIDYNEISEYCEQHPNENEKNIILHCKLVRDADKLDIYKQAAQGLLATIVNVTKDSGLTPEVYDYFKNKKLVNNKCLKTTLDKAVLQLAMAYDLNFAFSKEFFINNNYAYGIINNYKNALSETDLEVLKKLIKEFAF